MSRVGIRGIFLFTAGIFFLIAPRWLPDVPLWKRAAIGLLGVGLLGLVAWLSKQPRVTATGSRIVQGYWVARAGIPGIIFLIIPFGLPDEALWKRAGMVLLGAGLLGLAAWRGFTEKTESKTE
jgi:hypothetical protein